ncbi:hypothetical protein EG347_14005 [Chryseobacterium sp. G0186]|nr:hypothetical protein EG347_14005 [Chryseobacterium sp. G0186]
MDQKTEKEIIYELKKLITMYQQFFGKVNKMRFDSPEEYYETLGFLAKSDGSIAIVWENNEDQGA